jgi:hypothetical protein
MDVAKLDWEAAYVASVLKVCCKRLFKMLICFKRILQVFYLDVAYVTVAIHICCKRMFQIFHLFQSYVAASVSCCKCRPSALVSMRAAGPGRGHRRREEAQAIVEEDHVIHLQRSPTRWR